MRWTSRARDTSGSAQRCATSAPPAVGSVKKNVCPEYDSVDVRPSAGIVPE